MTDKKALNEAIRRWGKNGAVQRRKPGTWTTKSGAVIPISTHSVGIVVMGLAFMVHGQGNSWDEAFAAADKRFEKKGA